MCFATNYLKVGLGGFHGDSIGIAPPLISLFLVRRFGYSMADHHQQWSLMVIKKRRITL